VVAHTIKNIDHCSIPPRLQIQGFRTSQQTYERFLRATIRDNVDSI